LFTLTGTATVTIEGRREGGEWFTLEDDVFDGVLTSDGKIVYDNAGLHQVRAVVSEHSGSKVVNVILSTAAIFPFVKPPAGRFG